jgi:hypothetical protein
VPLQVQETHPSTTAQVTNDLPPGTKITQMFLRILVPMHFLALMTRDHAFGALVSDVLIHVFEHNVCKATKVGTIDKPTITHLQVSGHVVD